MICSLNLVFPHKFSDLTLVEGIIGDYATMVVGKDSPLKTWLICWLNTEKSARDSLRGRGAVPSDMDRLFTAMVMQEVGEDPTAVKYIPYDGGDDTIAALLSGKFTHIFCKIGHSV